MGNGIETPLVVDDTKAIEEDRPYPRPVKVRCYNCYAQVTARRPSDLDGWNTYIIGQYRKEVAHFCSPRCMEIIAHASTGRKKANLQHPEQPDSADSDGQ
jgi:hypothetical protein